MRRSKRLIVEKIPSLNISDLSKAGALEPGWHTFPHISIRYPFLSGMRTTRYRVDLWMTRASTPTSFAVEWARCNLGGRRPWFKCRCGARVGKLYCGGMFIGCRHCYGAVYECQRRSAKGRLHQQASKIRLSLGGAPTIAQPFPERPRRMWRKTYARLKQKAQKYERELRGTRFARRPPDYSRFSFF